jgi:hypothetical protein
MGGKQIALRDMDWKERGRYRRANRFYMSCLSTISKASLLSADRLRALAAEFLHEGKKKYGHAAK